MKKNFDVFSMTDVCNYFGLSESTIRKKVRESREGKGNFPLPLFKSGCKVLWRKSDIETWHGEDGEVVHFMSTGTSATSEAPLNLAETHKRLAKLGISLPQANGTHQNQKSKARGDNG